jgi:hypothetical protein
MPGIIHAKRASGDLIQARGNPIELESTEEVMQYMPGGVNEICAHKNGKPTELVVEVTPQTARVLQASLVAHRGESRHQPYFDFNHEEREASGHPTEFFWSETPEPGVYARVRWTGSGIQAVNGRTYRAFSPNFFADRSSPARVIGSPFCMGSLVNDPAFRRIRPFRARRASTDPQPHMNKTKKLMALLAAIHGLQGDIATLQAKGEASAADTIKAKRADLEAKLQESEALQAEIDADGSTRTTTLDKIAAASGSTEEGLEVRISDATGALTAKDSEISALRAEKERLEGEVQATRKREADAAVQAAVARGVIPAQNTAEQNEWRAAIAANPAMATRLAAINASAGLVQAGRMVAGDSHGRGTQVEVVQGDVIAALEAYGKAENSHIAAELWRSDLRPRVEKGNDLVEAVRAIGRKIRSGIIQADNSLGTLSGVLVVQRSLDFLKLTFPVLTRISTDFSDKQAKLNQTINTRLRTALTAKTFVVANGYEDTDAGTTDVGVVIDKHKYIQVKFGVEELASTMRGLFDEQEEPMHYALGSAMVDDLYALTTHANYGNKTTAAQADFKRTTVVSMGIALSKRKVPAFGRTVLLNSDYYGQLCADDTIVALAAQQDRSIITVGQLPDVHGFRVIEAPNLPTTANLTGFAFRPDAWAMASRVPADYTEALQGLPATGRVQYVTNPDTGITVMLVQYVDHKAGVARGRLAIMYGVAKAQTDSAQRLVSA